MDIRDFGRLTRGFMASRIVLTANDLGIFEQTRERRPASEVAGAVKGDPRATEMLLDALVALGLLEKSKGLYRNTLYAERFLLAGSPSYQGDILRHMDSLWDNWSSLTQVLHTGKPARNSHDHEAFILGMDNIARLRVAEVFKRFSLRGVSSALDLGGGPGTYSEYMAGKGVDVTLMDLPETVEIARARMRGRVKIKYRAGDFLKHKLGKGYDLILVSQILHAYGEKDCLKLLGHCKAALNKGGRIVIQEMTLDETRTKPPAGAIFAINMLVNTEGGRTYHAGEMAAWLRETGFKAVSVKHMDDTVLVMGKAG